MHIVKKSLAFSAKMIRLWVYELSSLPARTTIRFGTSWIFFFADIFCIFPHSSALSLSFTLFQRHNIEPRADDPFPCH